MQYMIQNTSGKIWFGPIVKSTDGYNPLTGVGTAAATAAVDFVYGTSSTGGMTTAHSWEEIGDGLYLVGLASDCIGSLGGLRVNFVDSSGIPTYEDVRILAANQYNSLIATSDYLQTDMVQVGGTGVTTQAAVNWSTFFDNAGVAVGKDIGDVSTFAALLNLVIASTQSSVNVHSIADEEITTDAADNWDNFWFNNDVVSTERVSELPTTADLCTFTTALPVDVGRIAGATVATGSAQIGVNAVAIASEAITSQAADNLNAFFDAAGATVTKIVNDVTTMTSANLSTFTTALPVDVGRIAGATVATGSAQIGVNAVAIASEAITSQAADNWNAFFDHGGATVTKEINDITTMTSANLSTFTTALEVDIGQVKGAAITDINDFICSGYTIGTGDRPYGDFLTALNAFVLPNASWDGTTIAYHTSDGGTTVFTVAIATDDAVYTTY